MNTNAINSPFRVVQPFDMKQNRITPHEAQQTFKLALQEAIQGVNDIQQESAMKTELLAQGKIENLHDVMITGQKASITLQATVEIRNKVIEAYQEMMRMQV